MKDAYLDVIIVGAGIAGITCANELKTHGLNPIILESRARIGGRVHTVYTDGVTALESGALFLHNWPNHPLNRTDTADSLQTAPVDYGKIAIFDHDGHRLTHQEMNELSELALELSDAVECIFEEDATDYSLQELVDTALSEADLLPIESRAIHWILANREIEAGLRLSKLSYSSLTAPDLVEHPELDQEPLDVMVPAGITALLHRLAEGVLILTERRVTTVEQLSDAVRVGCHSGEQYSAPHAVVTTPPGVLKSNTIRFHPPLPACHEEALEGIDVGERIQVTLDFANVFWPKSPHFLGYLAQEENAFAQFVNHYPITGQVRLTALAGDASARRLSSASHEQLVSVAMATLRRMLGAANIEAPTHSSSSRWLTEPGSLGATAGLISGSSPATRTAFSQPHGRVWLAGDATHVGKPNSIEGAAASGLEVARNIISLNQRNHDCP